MLYRTIYKFLSFLLLVLPLGVFAQVAEDRVAPSLLAMVATRIDMTLSRMTCFNLFMPGSIKQNIEVVMMDLSKREMLAFWDWNVISFLTHGSGRHLVKIKF